MSLLRVCPAQLSFVYDSEREVSCTLILRNMHDTQHVAFKVKTTAPDRYFVSPRLGSIPPQMELQMTLSRQPQSSYTSAEDRFLFEIAALPEGQIGLFGHEMPAIEQQVFLRATLHASESNMPALVRALRKVVEPHAAEHMQVLQGYVALLLTRGILAESQKNLANGVAAELYSDLNNKHAGAHAAQQNGAVHANLPAASQAGGYLGMPQNSHPVLDRVGSRRLTSLQSVQGISQANLALTPSLMQQLSDEPSLDPALRQHLRYDPSRPLTLSRAQSASQPVQQRQSARHAAEMELDRDLPDVDERPSMDMDQAHAVAGLTTTQWSDDSILSQDTDDMVLPARKRPGLDIPYPLQTMGASSPDSQIGSGMLSRASGLEPHSDAALFTDSHGDEDMAGALAQLGFSREEPASTDAGAHPSSWPDSSPPEISTGGRTSRRDYGSGDVLQGQYYATPSQADLPAASHADQSGGFDATRPMMSTTLADEFMDEDAPSLLAKQGWHLTESPNPTPPSVLSSMRSNKPATIPEVDLPDNSSTLPSQPAPHPEEHINDSNYGQQQQQYAEEDTQPAEQSTGRWLPHMPTFALKWGNGKTGAAFQAPTGNGSQLQAADQSPAGASEALGEAFAERGAATLPERSFTNADAGSAAFSKLGEVVAEGHDMADRNGQGPSRISTPPPRSWHPASRADGPALHHAAPTSGNSGLPHDRSAATLPERILQPLMSAGSGLRSNSSRSHKRMSGGRSNVHPLLADDTDRQQLRNH